MSSVPGSSVGSVGDRELGPAEAPMLLERALRTIEVHKDITTEELVANAHLPLDDTMALVEATHDQRLTIEL